MLAVIQRTGSPDQQLMRLLFGVIYTVGAIFVLSVLGRLVFRFIFSRRRRLRSAPFRANKLQSVETNPSEGRVFPAELPYLIERLRSIDWFQFEKVVAAIYRKLGYQVTRRGGANPDGGIDLIIEMQGVKTGIQCKQWKVRNVGVPTMREFLGALTHAHIENGIFITLFGYTDYAKEFAEEHQIEMLNERGLQNLLESVDANYDPDILAILNDTTKYCPKCEGVLMLRTAVNGKNPGSQFWGCSGYPHCRFTIPAS